MAKAEAMIRQSKNYKRDLEERENNLRLRRLKEQSPEEFQSVHSIESPPRFQTGREGSSKAMTTSAEFFTMFRDNSRMNVKQTVAS